MMKLYVNNGKVLVWNYKDVYELRKTHHIVGSFIGCIHRLAFQQEESSFPMLLMAEEATLLQERGIARLVCNRRVGEKPDASEVECYKKLRNDLFDQQIVILEENVQKAKKGGNDNEITEEMKAVRAQRAMKRKASDNSSAIDHPKKKIAIDNELLPRNADGRSLVLESMNYIPTNSADSVSSPKQYLTIDKLGSNIRAEPTGQEVPVDLELPEDLSVNGSKGHLEKSKELPLDDNCLQLGKNLSLENAVPNISKISESVPQYQCKLSAKKSHDQEKENCSKKDDICRVQQFTECPWKDKSKDQIALWNFPRTEKEKLRYGVFKDLWQRGYYLTTGTKFGGDFLVYPGDPELFHALFIVFCMTQEENFSAIDLTILGRMGHQVKKTLVLASFAEDSTVEYISLSWNPDVV